MEIKNLEIFPLSVPYIPVIQKYQPQDLHPTIVRVLTDEGVDGIGGGSHEVQWTRRNLLLKEFSKLKGKDPLELSLRDVPYPFNVALYDIIGKKLGVPVSWLLGGQVRNRVPLAYWTHARATPEETATEAREAVKKGYKVLKWHVNLQPETILKKVKAIHDEVGDKLAIRVDMKYEEQVPWGFATTVKIARQISKFNIECLEDPLPSPRNPKLHRLLKRKINIPLAWHTGDPYEVFQGAKHEACDYFNVERCRNVDRGLKAAAVAEAAGKPVWIAAPGGSTGVHYVFGLHLASAIGNATLPADTCFLLEEDFVREPLPQVADGLSEVPRKPGLGVQLDETAMEEHMVKRPSSHC